MPATCAHKLMTPTHLLIRELHLQPGNTGCRFQLTFLVGQGKSLKCCRCELKKNKSRGPLCLGTSDCLVGWLWCRLPESERAVRDGLWCHPLWTRPGTAMGCRLLVGGPVRHESVSTTTVTHLCVCCLKGLPLGLTPAHCQCLLLKRCPIERPGT